MEPHVGIEKNFESMYQIVLGMSNQFLTTHLSRIVRCRVLVGSQKVADGDYRECRRPEIGRSAKLLFRSEARKLVATMRGDLRENTSCDPLRAYPCSL
jgi:hypothetical protein